MGTFHFLENQNVPLFQEKECPLIPIPCGSALPLSTDETACMDIGGGTPRQSSVGPKDEEEIFVKRMNFS
jgi:hypothetical protein